MCLMNIEKYMSNFEDNLYLKIPVYHQSIKHKYLHLDKDNLTYTTIIKKNDYINELNKTEEEWCIDHLNHIYFGLMTSKEKTSHYIIHNNDHEIIISEKFLMNIYNGKKLKFKINCYLEYMGKRSCIATFSSTKIGITNQLNIETEHNEYIDKIMDENEKIKKICIKEILLNYYSGDLIDSGFKDNAIQVFENYNQNIILFGNKYFCYDLSKQKVSNNVNIEEYLCTIFRGIYYIHSLNNHQYLIIGDLTEYKDITSTPIRAIISTIIFTSLKITNDNFDIFFRFD